MKDPSDKSFISQATCLAARGRLVEVESAGERDYLTRVASVRGNVTILYHFNVLMVT